MKISATIIVRNEEENLEAVCESIAWADEIVIVDSDSTDETVSIARRYTDKVFNREFKGYKDKHEYADSQTTGDWIFWIDADERVTPELMSAIEQLRAADPTSIADGYKIARRTSFLNKWIRHSGWYPDYQMRLYRKSASYWDGAAPHQTARVRGRVDTLEGELLHYTKRSLGEYHRVLESYATLAAEDIMSKGKRAGAVKIFGSAIAAFFRAFIIRQGFRDGIPGLIIAMFTGYGVFLKYAKVWEHNNLEK
jgi:glycosyltransferase involved in cell wall biosynthesis